MTQVRFRWLAHGAGLPKPEYRTAGAAGLDLAAAVPNDRPLVLAPGGRALVPTGLALELPEGLEAQIRPRSGLALSHGITVLNTPGTIDADYRGEIGVILLNLGDQDFHVVRGLRIAQLVVSAYVQIVLIESVELSGTTRGDKGFGSTNDNGCADYGE